MAKKTISFTLDESIARKLEEQAKYEHRNISNLLEHLISCYLEREKIMISLVNDWSPTDNKEMKVEKKDVEQKEEQEREILSEKLEKLSEKDESKEDSILNHIRHNF